MISAGRRDDRRIGSKGMQSGIIGKKVGMTQVYAEDGTG